MTFAHRFVLLLGVPLVAMIALGVLTRTQIARIEAQAQFVAESRISALVTLGHLARHLTELRGGARRYLMADDQAQADEARSAFDLSEREVVRLLRHYADSLLVSDQGRRLAGEMQSLSLDWVAGARQAMSLADAGKRAEAVELLNGPLRPVNVRLGEVLDAWMENNDQLADQAGREAVDAAQKARRRMLTGHLAVVLLTGLLGVATYRKVVAPIRSLESSVRAIAGGDYAQPVPFVGARDEAGALARSISVLKEGASALDEQRWIKGITARLTRELNESMSLEEFGERLLSTLMPLLGGGVATLYLLDGAGDRLQRVASYGMADREDQAAALRLGEGLVGECARARQIMKWSHLPPDYLRITSGLGKAPPSQVVAYPLLTPDAVPGVLEVAGFQPAGSRDQALLDELLPVAALSLVVLQRNLAKTELLSRSQEQARALTQAQQELRETEQFFRSVLELAPDGLLVVDAAGTIQLANLRCEVIFGYSRDDLIGKSVDLLVPDSLRGRHAGLRASYHAAPAVREMGAGRGLHARRSDGSLIVVEIGLSPLPHRPGHLEQVAVSVRSVAPRTKTSPVEDSASQDGILLGAAGGNRRVEIRASSADEATT